jgi:hypothetical protein
MGDRVREGRDIRGINSMLSKRRLALPTRLSHALVVQQRDVEGPLHAPEETFWDVSWTRRMWQTTFVLPKPPQRSP